MRKAHFAMVLLGSLILVPVAQAQLSGWQSLSPSPLERTEVGAARVGGQIFVVGGFVPEGGSTGRMVRYEIADDAWREVKSLPIAVNHPGVTSHHGSVYVLGGFRDDGQISNRLYRYDPEQDRWKRLPDAPTARGALGLVGIGGRLYAAGGTTAATGEFRGLEIYDIDRRRWTEGPPMPTGRNHVAAAVFKGGIVVTGGRTDSGTNLDVVERYYRRNDDWNSMRRLTVPRSGHAAATLPTSVLPGRIVVFGGEQLSEGDSTIPSAEFLDISIGDWAPLPDMPTPRHGLGGASLGDTVYSLEGGPQPGLAFSSALESLQISR